MWPGLPLGTISTSLLVANVTGREQRPSREQRPRLVRARRREHVGRRAALDLRLSVFEPAKLYEGAGDGGEGVAQRRGGVDVERLGAAGASSAAADATRAASVVRRMISLLPASRAP